MVVRFPRPNIRKSLGTPLVNEITVPSHPRGPLCDSLRLYWWPASILLEVIPRHNIDASRPTSGGYGSYSANLGEELVPSLRCGLNNRAIGVEDGLER